MVTSDSGPVDYEVVAVATEERYEWRVRRLSDGMFAAYSFEKATYPRSWRQFSLATSWLEKIDSVTDLTWTK